MFGWTRGAENIVTPPGLIFSNEASSARVAAEIEVLRQVETEGLGHFVERPVRDTDQFKAAGEAFMQPRLHVQRGRAQDHYAQGKAPGAVGIPQTLDRLGPPGNLLNLVEDQHVSTSQLFRLAPGFFPLPHQPIRVPHLGKREDCLGRVGWNAESGRIGFVNGQVTAPEVDPR